MKDNTRKYTVSDRPKVFAYLFQEETYYHQWKNNIKSRHEGQHRQSTRYTHTLYSQQLGYIVSFINTLASDS